VSTTLFDYVTFTVCLCIAAGNQNVNHAAAQEGGEQMNDYKGPP